MPDYYRFDKDKLIDFFTILLVLSTAALAPSNGEKTCSLHSQSALTVGVEQGWAIILLKGHFRNLGELLQVVWGWGGLAQCKGGGVDLAWHGEGN